MPSLDTGQTLWMALAVFLLGMSKGGFPVGQLALPILILVWPDQTQSAQAAVAFMLPLLCVMDIVALWVYRRHILWPRIVPLLPSTVAGILAGSLLYATQAPALAAISDRVLKLAIGSIGVLFVIYHLARDRVLARLAEAPRPGPVKRAAFGFAAGLTSTIAHAAAPLMQMYFLPQRLEKLHFAGTTCAFFFLLNHLKLIPFSLLGRLSLPGPALGAVLLAIIPLGIAAGHGTVKAMRGQHYVWFIQGVLLVASLTLIVKAAA